MKVRIEFEDGDETSLYSVVEFRQLVENLSLSQSTVIDRFLSSMHFSKPERLVAQLLNDYYETQDWFSWLSEKVKRDISILMQDGNLEEKQTKSSILDSSPLDCMDLSVRCRRAISRLGVKTVRDLIAKQPYELLEIPQFGQYSIEELRSELSKHGLTLRGNRHLPPES